MNLDDEIEVQDHVADYYVNSRYQGLGLRYHTRIIKEMMNGANGRVLDVGCGAGIISDLYPKLEIVGIDVSKGMLRHHKGNHLLASACDIPFPDESFDFVVCRSVLHHIPDVQKALSEIKRVLRPGGGFVCWETNKSFIAQIVRRFTQHGDHFSKYHTSFSDLPSLVSNFFDIEMVKYQGFLGYCVYGFPDILPIGPFFPSLFDPLCNLDEMLSHIPLVNRYSFAIMIKGKK